VNGPFETEHEARELPAVRAIYDAMHASRRRGVMGERGYRLLDEACRAAGVQVGAYDHRILVWLAGFEPETCAVVAGLISRAHAAGRAAAAGEPGVDAAAEDARRHRATLTAFDEVARILAAFDWEHDDRQLALEAIERVVLTGGQP
jgi:hypothetical protein